MSGDGGDPATALGGSFDDPASRVVHPQVTFRLDGENPTRAESGGELVPEPGGGRENSTLLP
eukprot:7295777-Pyramimonas_sp.AAC.1